MGRYAEMERNAFGKRADFELEDWMKGCPALPGGPLKSKPTRLNTTEFKRGGFFCCARFADAADAAAGGRLDGGTLMKVRRTVLCTAVGLAALGVMGCDVFMGGHEREDRVVVEQRPVIVEQRPVYVEPPRREVIVERAPPVVEVRVR
jgi:hypothetical protein